MQTVEYKQKTISRKDPFGAAILKRKMHTLKHQEKLLKNRNLTETPDVEENIKLFFKAKNNPKDKIIIELEIPTLKAGEKQLSKNIKLRVMGNKKITIVGSNGVGKTTLLKEIKRQIDMKKDLKIGYMPQTYNHVLNSKITPLEYLKPKTKEELTKYKTALGNVKLTPEEMETKIENLSEGTKAKIILVKLILDECNILILDEPTRNISPLSNPAVRTALRDFKGSIISVSHDREYIKEVSDEIYELTKDGLYIKKDS